MSLLDFLKLLLFNLVVIDGRGKLIYLLWLLIYFRISLTKFLSMIFDNGLQSIKITSEGREQGLIFLILV